MRGLPKHFSTKKDYLNCLSDGALADAVKGELQKLLDRRFIWKNGAELADGDAGLTDDTHKVVEGKKENDDAVRVQYELIEDENAELFLLGFSVAEVEELLK